MHKGGFPGRTAATRKVWLAFLLPLALLPLATFWPVLSGEFIEYDDPGYVTVNAQVRRGLTWAGARWALTTGYAGNWHPLTWISHMADVSLSGLNPAGHHATNLLLHVANTLLVFLVFRSLTGALWRSAGVAALFAVHPAHVESIAWVAERKDLLCTAFWLATTWAYADWVRKRSRGRYLLVLVLFLAGLMSKPMIVTLPVVLLLLDYWPLDRFRDGERRSLLRLALEKAPLFLMAAASSFVTVVVQRAGGAVRSLETFSVGTRIANVLVAYVRYLKILVWPADLAIFYPHPGTSLPPWAVVGSAALLLGLSAAAVALRRKAPFLFVGWYWFLVTLIPVIGVVQVGYQALADRYTYVPFLGLFLAAAWGLPAVVSRWRSGGVALRWGAAAVLLALSVASSAQARLWKSSETLFLHALKVTKDNYLAGNNLGQHYNETGRPAEALPYLLEAARINPTNPDIRNNIGVSLFLQNRFDEALRNFQEASRLGPTSAIPLNNFARTQFVRGEIREAIRIYQSGLAIADAPESRRRLALAMMMEGETAAALTQAQRGADLDPYDGESAELLRNIALFRRDPEDPSLVQFRRMLADAQVKASAALFQRGKTAEAGIRLGKALALDPGFPEAHNELGTRLVGEGRLDDAAAEFEAALRINPALASGHNNLGYVLFLKGQRAAAIEQYLEALRLQPDFPLARNNLELAQREPVGK